MMFSTLIQNSLFTSFHTMRRNGVIFLAFISTFIAGLASICLFAPPWIVSPLIDTTQLVAGAIISSGQLLQLKKTYQTKDVTGLSTGSVLSVALACWMFELYALWNMQHVVCFLITNSISTILSTLMTMFYFEYQHE